MLRYLSVLLTAMGLMTMFSVHAEEAPVPYQVGDSLPALALQDQHDKPQVLSADIQVVLYTTGMKGGGVIRDILDNEEADYLPSRNAMFISNISGMPGVIASMIALPRMRSHDYSIVLDAKGEATARIPAQSNSATILRLENRKITDIQFTKNPEVVRAAVEQSAQ